MMRRWEPETTPAGRMLLPFILLLASGGCTSTSYMGISLVPGGADAAVQQLALRARLGNKRAQFDLGTRFEEGRGVGVNLSRAAALYGRAATDEAGRLWIYAPSPGGGAPARVMSVERETSPGLAEARERLRDLLDAPR